MKHLRAINRKAHRVEEYVAATYGDVVALQQGPTPPRPHYPMWSVGANARRIGEVTSGTQSPSLGIGIGMGYVPPDFARPDTPIEIEIRGKRAPAIVVSKPIYRKPI